MTHKVKVSDDVFVAVPPRHEINFTNISSGRLPVYYPHFMGRGKQNKEFFLSELDYG
jgi:hypothetical protein